MMCDWCGHEHPREALCAKRPTWGRRGFLAMVGVGLVGMALPGGPAAIDFGGLSIGDALTQIAGLNEIEFHGAPLGFTMILTEGPDGLVTPETEIELVDTDVQGWTEFFDGIGPLRITGKRKR